MNAKLLVPLLLLCACRPDPKACPDGSCDSGPGIDGGDADGDGWTTPDDCDDGDAAIHPDAGETPYDGIDQDCDGADLVDVDGDGYAYTEECDDDDADSYPGASEIPYDGVDQDCDGADLVDVDGDGYPYTEECDDESADVSPDVIEVFGDEIDNDCDSVVDEVYVCATGGDFVTVQEGVDAAPGYGLVEICPGTYYESVVLPDRSLTIMGSGVVPGDVLIDASGEDSAIVGELTGGAEMIIENLALTGSIETALIINGSDERSEAHLQHVDIFGLTDGSAIYISFDSIEMDFVNIYDGFNEHFVGGAYIGVFGRDGGAKVTHLSAENITYYAVGHPLLGMDGKDITLTNSLIVNNSLNPSVVTIPYTNVSTEGMSITIDNNTISDNSFAFEDDSTAILLSFYYSGIPNYLSIQNNIISSNIADWAIRVTWDWCNWDIPEVAKDAMYYNLLFGADSLSNSENGCDYSSCSCWDYQTDTLNDMFWSSSTNVSANPDFIDGEYYLNPYSPAIDAGNPDSSYNDPDGTRNDLGAYGGPLGNW